MSLISFANAAFVETQPGEGGAGSEKRITFAALSDFGKEVALKNPPAQNNHHENHPFINIIFPARNSVFVPGSWYNPVNPT